MNSPAKETEQPAVCTYAIEQWGVIMGRRETIYVYGHASYRDTVDPVAIHYLEFCTCLYGIGLTAKPFNPGPSPMSEECRHHNCADDECKAG